MRKFSIRVNGKTIAVKDDLTEIITFGYDLLEYKVVGMAEIIIQEDSWKVDEKGNPTNGRTRTVAFEKVDEFVRDGEVLEDLSFFYPNPLLTNIGRN